jgi:hypothetical protein
MPIDQGDNYIFLHSPISRLNTYHILSTKIADLVLRSSLASESVDPFDDHFLSLDRLMLFDLLLLITLRIALVDVLLVVT